MSRIPSPPKTTSNLKSHFFGLTAALTLGLVGCQAEGPEPGTQVRIELESDETTLIKPPEQTSLLPPKGPPPTDTPLLTVEVVSTARENREEEANCFQDQLFGNISVEIGGPSAAFEDDDISEEIKVVLLSETRAKGYKVELSLHLSKDEILDDGDLLLSTPNLVAASPESFSELQAEHGKLQPLVGIDPGEYHIFVHINEHISNSNCFLDDNIASFPLEVI